MPFPGEHAARINDPKRFDPKTFRRTTGPTKIFGRIPIPATMAVIWAKLKERNKPKDSPLVQSLRFPVEHWTVTSARAWLKKNSISFDKFEPATKKKDVKAESVTEDESIENNKSFNDGEPISNQESGSSTMKDAMEKSSLSAIYDEINGKVWAITKTSFNEILKLLSADNIEASVHDDEQEDERAGFHLRDSIAIIPINGILSRRGTMFQRFFGFRSMINIEEVFIDLINDPNITGIILDVDSPGGTLTGTDRLAKVIRDNRANGKKNRKVVVAHTSGQMASAAFWIGSAADFVIAEESARIGNIGVRIRHVDRSEQNKKEGIKITHIASGTDKILANEDEPLGEKARKFLQENVDAAMGQFIRALNLNRKGKIKMDKVVSGTLFRAKDARKLGLIDRVGTIEDAIKIISKEGISMNAEEIKTEFPDAVKILVSGAIATAKEAMEIKAISDLDQMKAGLLETANTEKKEAVADAVTTYKTRVADIRKLAVDGQEELVETLINEDCSLAEATTRILEDIRKNGIKKPTKAKKTEQNNKEALKTILDDSAPEHIEKGENENEEGSLLDQYRKITDSGERATFYSKHEKELIKLENIRSRSAKKTDYSKASTSIQ